MKKQFLFIFIMLSLCLTLFACTNENNEKDYESILDKALEQLTIPDQTDIDITLTNNVTIDECTIYYNWTSSNTEVISELGKVTRQEEDTDVTLSCKATSKESEIEKEKSFSIKVLKKEKVIDNDFLNEALQTIILVEETKTDIDLPKLIDYKGIQITVTWFSSNTEMNSEGKVFLPEENDKNVTLKAHASYLSFTAKKEFTVKVISCKTICMEASKDLVIPETINDDITLPESINGIPIEWYSNNKNVLSNDGKCSYVSTDTEVTLMAGLYIELATNTYYYDLKFPIIVKPYSQEKRLEKALENIVIPEEVKSDLILPNTFSYDCIGKWVSSNEDVFTSYGRVNPLADDCLIDLELQLQIKNELGSYDETKKAYKIKVLGSKVSETESNFYKHNLIDRANDYVLNNLTDLELNNGKIVLKDGALIGTYESKIFNTLSFDNMVGSWSCVTSKDATCELAISIRINGVWSKYFSYGVWGLGKENYYYNQTDTSSKMSVDEIMVTSGKADGVRYKVTLRRNAITTTSPSLSLVCMALNITDSNYYYAVDKVNLPLQKDNDLPKLYQYDVPEIGGSICSATTTTMLLKWKGHSFKNLGYTYEHEFIAHMVADPGHNSPTYGNWSYNMAVAGAYGENAYVGKMRSFDEVKEHLNNVGPLGASIKGYFGYNTNGHLIVVRGYRVVNGQTTVICNDPAVRNVYYEVTLQMFMNCWRNTVYIVE